MPPPPQGGGGVVCWDLKKISQKGGFLFWNRKKYFDKGIEKTLLTLLRQKWGLVFTIKNMWIKIDRFVF